MFLTNLVYLFHIVFHCILLFVSVAHRDLTVYALINMALLLLLLLSFTQGYTPLHLAARVGSEQCCRLLLQANSNVNLADSNVSILYSWYGVMTL